MPPLEHPLVIHEQHFGSLFGVHLLEFSYLLKACQHVGRLIELSLDRTEIRRISLSQKIADIDLLYDPLEEILFISIYFSLTSFDIYDLLRTLKDLRVDSNMVRTLTELQQEPQQPAMNIGGALFRACFYGDIPPEQFLKEDGTDTNVFDLLLIAEANQKQGRLKEAASIYNHLLSGKQGPQRHT